MSNLTGQTLLGRYRVDAFVGRGGMAEVYKAWDLKRAAYVALKLLNSDLAEDFVFLRRFTREAQTMERLEHPNIVRLLGFKEASGMALMVMEFIDGVTLRRHLNLLGRPLTLAETLGVLQPLCSALHYAHQMGIYHCDIKPANIFLECSARIVLGDFGIARLSESATVTYSTPGTPAYMSPEQCRGREEIDGRSDIYSLSITAYEMLTLDRPFKGEADTSGNSLSERVRWEQIHAPPPALSQINPHIPPEIEAVIDRALEKNPSKRYQSALDFLQAFQRAAAAEPVKILPKAIEEPQQRIEAASPLPAVIHSKSAAKQYGIFVMLICLAVVGVVLIAFSGTMGNSNRQPAPGLSLPLSTVSSAPVSGPTLAIKPSIEPTPVLPAFTLTAANPNGIMVGGFVTLLQSLNFRQTANTSAPIIQTLPKGELLTVTGGPRTSDNLTWWKLKDSNGVEGWLPQDYLQPTAAPAYPTLVTASSNIYLYYIVDASNSMMQDIEGATKLAMAQSALQQHWQSLEPTINAGLLAFGHRVSALDDVSSCKDIEVLITPQSQTASKLGAALVALKAQGKSPLEEALNTAFDDLMFQRDRTNALILIADGGDNCAGDPIKRIRIRQEVGQRLPIFVIGLGIEEPDRNVLRSIADETGGLYCDAASTDQLVQALNEFVQIIQK